MAISFRPAAVRNDLEEGKTLLEQGAFAQALACFDRSIGRDPNFADGHVGRTLALRALGRLAEALVSYDTAIALSGGDAGMISNRGMILLDLQRNDEALACFDRAIAIDPSFVGGHHNRGVALLRQQRLRAACANCELVLALQLQNAGVRASLGTILLQLGEFTDGWKLYEWRKTAEYPAGDRQFAQPLWLGDTDISGKTLLIHAEQGLGDTLQFCRYAKMIAVCGANVILAVPPALLRLLRQSFPAMAVVNEDEPLESFEFHCPMLSLPLAMGTTLATIPSAMPYLVADPDRVARWRDRLAPLSGLKIGLVWSGSGLHQHPAGRDVDKRRSIALTHYAGLADIPGITLISLQKGEPAIQARTPPAGMVLHDWTDELDDFADTADLIAALDLVITVDTSVAHLAGGLGKPVWILNRFDQCWRWLEGRDDSPWYPTARLFRQSAPGDWDSVITALCAALHQPFTRGQIAITVSPPSTT